MSGLFGWFDKRDFLERFENESPAALSGSELSRLGRTNCAGTKDCGAGFACIDGVCQRVNAPTDNATGDTAGDCNNGAGGSSPCGSGSRACSDGGNCGSGSPVGSCCGQAVSYRVKDPSTGKFITSCERPGGCRPFCTSYFASFGTMPDGCEGYDPCFSDCEICGVSGGAYSCQKKLVAESTPCYCDNGARCGNCRACITDPASSNYGNCEYVNGLCGKCVTMETHFCCGVNVGPVTVCTDGSTPANVALQERLEELCAGECDQCENNAYEKYCSNQGDWDQRPDTSNLPAGTTFTGSLQSGGVECQFFKVTDRSNCDGCITEPVCHCHADCPPGQTCTGVACV